MSPSPPALVQPSAGKAGAAAAIVTEHKVGNLIEHSAPKARRGICSHVVQPTLSLIA